MHGLHTPHKDYVDPARFPESVRDLRQGRLRPEPLEHRRQVPVERPGLQVAGQLDQGARERITPRA